MSIKVISAQFTDEKTIDAIEEDYMLFETNHYAIQDYMERKGYYELEIYLTNPADEHQIIHYLKDHYPQLHQFQITFQKQKDWFEKWKQSLQPVWLTPKCLVDPALSLEDEVRIIRITPGMAFGTGYHETTRLSALLIEKYIQKGNNMLDIGCGSGILSIMGAQMGCHVTAVDLDPFAIEATQENTIKNNVSTQISIQQSDLLESVSGQFDLICGNILFDILKRLFLDEAKRLKSIIHSSSTLIFSGLVLSQYNDFKQLIEQQNFKIIDKVTEGDWFAIALKQKKTEVVK